MDDKRFEQLVSEGIDAIPERFLKQLKNVAIVIADEPTKEQLRQNGVPRGKTLLGLYEGIPLVERGDIYGVGAVLPDRITVFKIPTLEAAAKSSRHDETIARSAAGGFRGEDEQKIREIVKDTVWHEIGHYFGWGDDELYEREDEGKNFSI